MVSAIDQYMACHLQYQVDMSNCCEGAAEVDRFTNGYRSRGIEARDAVLARPTTTAIFDIVKRPFRCLP